MRAERQKYLAGHESPELAQRRSRQEPCPFSGSPSPGRLRTAVPVRGSCRRRCDMASDDITTARRTWTWKMRPRWGGRIVPYR